MTAQYQFVMRSGPNPGKIFLLEGSELIVGRDATCNIVIVDSEISRRHARITAQGSMLLLEDLGSTNGTFINGQRLTGSYQLKGGEMISFGENVVLACEPLVDPNATLLSTADKTLKEPAPKPVTAPPVIPQRSAPMPVPTPASEPVPEYSSDVPAPPEVVEKTKKKVNPLLIVALVIGFIIICLCVGALVLIDQLSLWCKVLPFLFPGRC
jgi:pSer/pThr/pTyr-binding forkhead associated (FHA) protein